MPGFMLNAGAQVQCMHGGQAQPAATNLRVRVGGQPVVTQTSSYRVTGCPFRVGGSPSPCVTAQWVRAATRVKAGGAPVLLQDSQAVCTPNGTGVTIVPAQERVRGM